METWRAQPRPAASDLEPPPPTSAARPDLPSRRPSPRSTSAGTVQRRQTETETERGRGKGATASRTASAPQHIGTERPPDRSGQATADAWRGQRPQPSQTPAKIPSAAAVSILLLERKQNRSTKSPKKHGRTAAPADAARHRTGEPLHFKLQRLSQISTQYHHRHTLTSKISSVARSV